MKSCVLAGAVNRPRADCASCELVRTGLNAGTIPIPQFGRIYGPCWRVIGHWAWRTVILVLTNGSSEPIQHSILNVYLARSKYRFALPEAGRNLEIKAGQRRCRFCSRSRHQLDHFQFARHSRRKALANGVAFTNKLRVDGPDEGHVGPSRSVSTDNNE